MLTEPRRWPANAFAVERILTQLQFLDTKVSGLEEPFLRIAMESDQTREALEIGNPVEPEQPSIRYAKLEDRPTVFEMEIDYLAEVENAHTNVRVRRVFEIDTEFASSVSFERGGTEVFSLQKLEPDESKTDEWEIPFIAHSPFPVSGVD